MRAVSFRRNPYKPEDSYRGRPRRLGRPRFPVDCRDNGEIPKPSSFLLRVSVTDDHSVAVQNNQGDSVPYG